MFRRQIYMILPRVCMRLVDTSILENCIKKNFHVPNMKSGPPAEGGCNFE